MSYAHEVLDRDGLRAYLDQSPPGEGNVMLRLEDGRNVAVPSHRLQPQANGSYRLDISADELTGASDSSHLGNVPIGKIEVVEESVRVGKRVRETGSLVVHVTPHEEARTIDVPLNDERVEVKRFAVNRIVDGLVQTRQEGDTTIVPVVEEVLVVQKKLMVREEIHIIRKRTARRERRQVVLRREEARVLRGEPPAADATVR